MEEIDYRQNLVLRISREPIWRRGILSELADKIGLKYEPAARNAGENGQYEIIFHGSIQDVGFRDTASSYAFICELSGIIANLNNGDVRAVVQGRNALVSLFNSSLKEDFRCSSRVTPQKIDETFQDFKIAD